MGLQNNLPAARTHAGLLLLNETEQCIQARIRWLDVGESTVFGLSVQLMRLLQAQAGTIEGLQYPGTIKGLEQVVDGVDVKSAHCILIESGGKNDLRHAVSVFALEQLLEHGEAIQARHLHIEKYHVGMVRTNEVDGLNAILPLGDDLDSAHRIQEVFELFARKPFIVDDQRSHCHVVRARFEYRSKRVVQDWKARRREGMLSAARL